jgi:hypothetical protein
MAGEAGALRASLTAAAIGADPWHGLHEAVPAFAGLQVD